MANRKLFNSKNVVNLLETLINQGSVDLAIQIINVSELKSLLPKIKEILKRKNLKLEDYKQVKVYSKTELKDEALKEISKALKVDVNGGKIIIDKNMSAGVRVKSGDKLIDASLYTMLQNGLEELLK
jgi:F0F1-type ATP synthase delta subunit